MKQILVSEELLRLATEAFEEFAAKYNHESSEWLDMGADETFIAGYLAALEQPAFAERTAVEPVAVVDANDDGYWADILPDRDVKVGQLLYAAPQAQEKS